MTVAALSFQTPNNTLRFVAALVTFVTAVVVRAAEFEPYQLNGGLVCAVAGRNFCVLATDTRMMDGGYEIYTRRHVSSRLWNVVLDDDHYDKVEPLLATDGSIRIPTRARDDDSNSVAYSETPPVWIGSAGCAADCLELKRVVRMDAQAFARGTQGHGGRQLEVHHVASMLANTLYQRRFFPYYTFCIVAGCTKKGGGHAFVYDAIGSYEQVAVAATGTGRDQLQPILDRLFSNSVTTSDKNSIDGGIESEEDGNGDEAFVGFSKKRAIGVLPKVVATQVDCSVEKAIENVKQAYHAVAEREIGVGDSLVLMVNEVNDTDDGGRVSWRTLKCPLKEH